MRVLALGLGWMLLAALPARAVEPAGCFRTAEQAAAGAGDVDAAGYRLEARRVDAVGGGAWAEVSACARPGAPRRLVRLRAAFETAGLPMAAKAVSVAEAPAVLAGSAVTVFAEREGVRLLMPGVAQASAVAGARLRVRVAGTEAGGAERFVAGIARAPGVVELAD